jgi:hypothetical protein
MPAHGRGVWRAPHVRRRCADLPIDQLATVIDSADSLASNAYSRTLTRLRRLLPAHSWLLAALYFIASLAHFAHNAEDIAFYPNMPRGLTAGDVYLVWLAITAFAAAGVLFLRMGLRALGLGLIAIYGALGLDGLAHYTLALCSEHTLAANLTIWAEAGTGSLLMLATLRLLWRHLGGRGDEPLLLQAPARTAIRS